VRAYFSRGIPDFPISVSRVESRKILRTVGATVTNLFQEKEKKNSTFGEDEAGFHEYENCRLQHARVSAHRRNQIEKYASRVIKSGEKISVMKRRVFIFINDGSIDRYASIITFRSSARCARCADSSNRQSLD